LTNLKYFLTFAPSNNPQPLKTTKKQAPLSLRFRRWSRAGYAVFCSLACTVTIGCLAVSISDKSLQKSVGVSKSSECRIATDAESRDKSPEILELEAGLHIIQETFLLNITSDSAAACPQVFKYLFYSSIRLK